jgi:hypothetical protein
MRGGDSGLCRARRKVAEEGTGTERQKQNAKLWADAAKVTLSDPLRHNPKASVK